MKVNEVLPNGNAGARAYLHVPSACLSVWATHPRNAHFRTHPSQMKLQERTPIFMPHLPAFLSGQPIPGMEACEGQDGTSKGAEGGGVGSCARRAKLLKEVQHFVCSLKQVCALKFFITAKLLKGVHHTGFLASGFLRVPKCSRACSTLFAP
eukprot:1161917-Pelagomonas_calceolata.AAC.14